MKSRTDRVVSVSNSRPTLLDLARKSGIYNLSPSDLVFEANQTGITYYDFVLSMLRRPNGFDIYMAKLDHRTNLEWFQTITGPLTAMFLIQFSLFSSYVSTN